MKKYLIIALCALGIFGLAPKGAGAVSLPAVTNYGAASIFTTSAGLQGSLTNLGGASSVTVGFNYGTSLTYGSTFTLSAPLTAVATFNEFQTGLVCNTLYHFRPFATNLAGTTYGADATFTTLSCVGGTPPTATTDSVTSITTTGATFTGTITSTGGVNPDTRFFNVFDRISYSGATPIMHGSFGVGPFTDSITGLTCGKSYWVHSYVVNSVGSTYGGDLLFTTLACPGVPPSVTTVSATSVTATSAVLNGNLTSLGSGTLTTIGFNNGGVTVSAGTTSSTGAFTATVTGLTCGTTYAFNATATNSGGSASGATLSFATPACVVILPVVTTDSATSITTTSAVLNGTIVSAGSGSPIFTAVFIFAPVGTALPPVSGMGGPYGLGAIYSTPPFAATGLTCATNYHYEAVAKNSAGIAYGADKTFSTLACPPPPTVTTDSVTPLLTGATFSGTIVSLGGAPNATVRGFSYNTTPTLMTIGIDPGISTPGTFGTGSYSLTVSSLTCGTAYHYRAYATTVNGTGIGVDKTFSTLPCPVVPLVTTDPATAITMNSATINGTVTGLGGAPLVTPEGFAGSFGSPISIPTSITTVPTAFSSNVTGLTCGTTYTFTANATNSAGTGYGATLSFTTTACPLVPPTVVTVSSASVTTTSAVLNGNLTSLGSGTLTTVGFTAGGVSVPAGTKSSTGTFTATATGLTCGTPYSFNATATNSGGSGSGAVLSFTTAACPGIPPTVVTVSATGVTATTAVLNGNLTSLGSGTLTTIGFTAGGLSVPAGTTSSTGAFTATATGLTCGTAYSFDATASNGGGSASSSTLSFTTTACPGGPTVITNPVTGITTTTATISGTVTAFGIGASTITSRKLVWTTGASTSTTLITVLPSTMTLPLSGLTCNTTYTVTASAINDLSLSGSGSTLSFTTSICPVGGPTVTTNAASAVTTTSATLSGTVSAFGTGATSITSRSFSGSFGATVTLSGVISSLPNTFTSNVTGLTCGTTYNFTAAAVNNAAVSGSGSSVSFTTSACVLTPPTVATGAASAVTVTSATLNGNLTSLGSGTLTTVGFNFGGTSVAAGTKSSTGTFSAPVTGLACGKIYPYFATATNSGGSATGLSTSFATPACPGAPSVTTDVVVPGTLSQTSATVQGTATAFGSGSTNATMSINYGLTPSLGSTVSLGGTITSVPTTYSYGFVALTCGTTYYYQASLLNNLGVTAVGATLNFTTDPCTSLPTVLTVSATSITTTTAVLNGNLVSDGGDPTTQVRFGYDLTPSYGFGTSYFTPGGLGAFNDTATGLTCGTLYHFAAFAANLSGIANGVDMTFTTAACAGVPPTVVTTSATGITATSAILNGNLISLGSGTLTNIGFNLGGATVSAGTTSSTGAFNATATGLTCATSYSVTANATNGGGSASGSTLTFTTSACPLFPPVVTTSAATGVTVTSATLNGNLTSLGSGSATTVGFLLSGSPVSAGILSATGPFSATVVVTCGKTYTYVSTAVNSGGTAATPASSSFTTPACATIPTVTTTAATSVTSTGAVINGNITSLGGSPSATSRGFTGTFGSPIVSYGPYGTGAYSATLTGLTCNTSYTFTANATTGAGTGSGSTLSFTTLPCNPSVVSVSAHLVTSSTAAFVGNLTGTGGFGVLNHVGFNYGPTLAYGYSIPATTPAGGTRSTTGTFSATATGLPVTSFTTSSGTTTVTAISCNVPWHMQAFAWNAGNPLSPVVGADIPFCN